MKTVLKKSIKKVLFTIEWYRAAMGNKVTCPICEHTFDHLHTFNARPNALCFHCRSLERDRSLYLYLKSKTDFFSKPVKVLHFAPEISLYPLFRGIPSIDYSTADLMVTLNSYLQVNPDYIMSVTDIKFGDNVFDYIICNHVLDDVDDDHKALTEFYRVLKPGGTAIVSVPLNTIGKTVEFDDTPEKIGLKKKMNISPENQRSYGIDFYERVEEKGFMVTAVSAEDLIPDLKKFAVRKEDLIYICLKK